MILLASALQAVTGFGFALIATPLLLVFLPPKVAVPLTMCVSLSCLILLSLRSRRHADVKTVKWLTVGSLFGIPIGAYVLTVADTQAIRLLASAVTLIIALYFVLKPRATKVVCSTPAPWFCLMVGAVSGLLTTSVSMPGPPVVLALSNAGMPKHQFRATGSAFFAVVYSISAVTLALSGVLNLQVLTLVAALVPVAVAGNMLGERLFNWVPQNMFDKAVPLLLMITAVRNVMAR